MLLYYRPAVQQYVLHDRLPPCAGPPWPAFVHDSAQCLELLRLDSCVSCAHRLFWEILVDHGPCPTPACGYADTPLSCSDYIYVPRRHFKLNSELNGGQGLSEQPSKCLCSSFSSFVRLPY